MKWLCLQQCLCKSDKSPPQRDNGWSPISGEDRLSYLNAQMGAAQSFVLCGHSVLKMLHTEKIYQSEDFSCSFCRFVIEWTENRHCEEVA